MRWAREVSELVDEWVSECSRCGVSEKQGRCDVGDGGGRATRVGEWLGG